MNPNFDILKRPLITERSTKLRESNHYVLEVDPRATKGQIKLAIEMRFKVDVLVVRTIRLPGKFRRRMGPKGGYQPDRKKAIVRVKDGQKITWEEAA